MLKALPSTVISDVHPGSPHTYDSAVYLSIRSLLHRDDEVECSAHWRGLPKSVEGSRMMSRIASGSVSFWYS
jgi:hypothetical protein